MSQKPIEQTDCHKCGAPTTPAHTSSAGPKRSSDAASAKARHTTYEVEEGIANDVFTDD